MTITLFALLEQTANSTMIRIEDNNGYPFCNNTVAEIKSKPDFIKSLSNAILIKIAENVYQPMLFDTVHHYQRVAVN